MEHEEEEESKNSLCRVKSRGESGAFGKEQKAHKRLFAGKSVEGEVRLLKDPVTCWESGSHFEGTKVTENLSLAKKYSQM